MSEFWALHFVGTLLNFANYVNAEVWGRASSYFLILKQHSLYTQVGGGLEEVSSYLFMLII